MGGQINAACSICGKGYHLCVSCKDAMRLTPYKMHCCSADCYKVFQAVKGYNTGVYSKEEFKTKLKNIDLSNLESYRDNIKTLIKDVLKEDMVKEPIIEEVLQAEEAVAKKSVISRKRNYKVNNEIETE